MSILTLSTENQGQLREWLRSETMLVACLCAAWCDVCRQYRSQFEQLAAHHAETNFVWIDIEDQADLVGDFDIDDFPSLLIQRGPFVTFFGSVPPSLSVAMRLIHAQRAKSVDEMTSDAVGSPVQQRWQHEIHLARRLAIE